MSTSTTSTGTSGAGVLGVRIVPVLPLPNGVVLPGQVVTIALESDEAQAAVDGALAHERRVLLVPRPEGRYASVGVVGRIENAGELPNGTRAIVVRATRRARLGSAVAAPVPTTGAPAEAEVLWLEAMPVDETAPAASLREEMREYRALVDTMVERTQNSRVAIDLSGVDDPSQLVDTIAYWPELSIERRVVVLETIDVAERFSLVGGWLHEAIAEHEVKQKIAQSVGEGMERQQREFLLRQQMAAIRKELGEGEDGADAVQQYRDRIEASTMPDAVRAAVTKEVDKLERLSDQSTEQGWIRNWLDTVLDLAWGVESTDRLDITAARAVLDADTTGLDDAKERIVEWLAVRKLRAERDDREALAALDESAVSTGTDDPLRNVIEPEGEVLGTADVSDPIITPPSSARRGAKGAIILLVGPPGVGKTSIGESIARALGRSFVRVALGGVRDEAEIRGHRRTYVGAQSGRLVKALREAKTMNPVILLDELDKLATGWSGDPAAALLEVLDPAQNHTFRDHYLEVDLDLSNVVFIATANTLDSLAAPLLDRMEIITVDGYTDDEKVAIARNHLLPRHLTEHGLSESDVEISDAALRAMIEGYTREAGVRSLERTLAKLLRKVALQRATTTAEADHPRTVDNADQVTELLGRPKRTTEEISSRTAQPGVATGLAVTGAGGDVLFVETTSMPSTGELGITVTGQLGEVMKESSSLALSFVRANAEALGIDPERLVGRRLHVHFPAGAVPKDGPSAGITMTTALVSLLTDRPVKSTVAMTGEVTLQGKVLPIGGVKQKLLAAHRAGIKTVIIPARNEPDLDDVPAHILEALSVHPVDSVHDVLRLALMDVAS
jgi:ATP-dependent Lon protease